MVLVSFLLLCAALVAYQLYTPPRPPRPPVGSTLILPFGAIFSEGALPLAQWRVKKSMEIQKSLPRKPREILILSSGGARGAFGAGVLSGWTATGERPQFDVVTGVSVGALQSVYAFLGSSYDDELLLAFGRAQELGKVSWWSRSQGALLDGDPLRESIAEHYDEETMAAVARRHQEGARLYVGTANLDTGEFVTWDMGAIASSGRPEALEQFRSVLQASCSMPALFPPVFFDLEIAGQSHQEMHVDGGTRAAAFLPRFIKKAAAGQKNVNVYLVVNHATASTPHVSPVSHTVKDIAFASFKMLLQDKLLYSVEVVEERCVDEHLGLKILAMPADWGGDEFSIRPENAVGDPAQLFQQSSDLITQKPWSKLPEETRY